ncbi:uncharacterized protein EDB91DRAFT_749640 [Suillus paluster]|uniref:uncharacterized protein n=1 Tax=Suillus paluster TaxID=48578 RepID=UPI001B876F76|nr:uncharacterized protein EDB91DRAFT_749640 [Suillus paluster]KAG1730685.1 hypothetical protein EDB91DRAFT_749640 [Suillus paluster]
MGFAAGKTDFMSGGNVPRQGLSSAATSVTAWYGSVLGLKVVSPWSAEDCKGLLKAAIRGLNPVIFLENEMMYGVTFPMSSEAMSDNFVLPTSKAKVEREGTDFTIVAHSKMVTHSIEASDFLVRRVSTPKSSTFVASVSRYRYHQGAGQEDEPPVTQSSSLVDDYASPLISLLIVEGGEGRLM